MVRKFQLNILIFFVLALLGTTACQRRNENRVQAAGEDRSTANVPSQADKQFMMEAEKNDVNERALGRLALQKSQNRDVRDYAQELVDDHSKALQELMKLMQESGMNPSTPSEAQNE